MNNRSNYPGPDQLDTTASTRVSADQQRHADYVVSSNRMFLVNLALCAAFLVMVIKDAWFHANFTPAVAYVQFEGGRPVLFKPDSSVVMDSLEYHPYRMRQVVKDFVERRYSVDYRNLGYILDGLRMMTVQGKEAEVAKIRALNLDANVTKRGLRALVTLNESGMKVTAMEKGRFRVTIPASLELIYQDGVTGENQVVTRETTIDLVVVAVRDNVAPLGYLIDATGDNRIW